MKHSPKAEKLARRLSTEVGITISGDDPIIALMLFEQERNRALEESFKKSQLELLKTITAALKVKPKKKQFDISLYLGIFNSFLLVLLLVLGFLK